MVSFPLLLGTKVDDMKSLILTCFFACLATSSASAGYVQDFVDAHGGGGCNGDNWGGTLMLLEQDRPASDGTFLEKHAGEWTDQDLEDYRHVYTACLRLHPSEVMSSFRSGQPIEAPPGAIEAKVDKRMDEIMRNAIDPARAALRQEEASRSAKQALAEAKERSRINGERAQARSREVAANAQREQENAREQEGRRAIQEQAKRDRDAAEQAKMLADREAPQIEATQKEASAARQARVEAEKHLEDVRQQVAGAQNKRHDEDNASAAAKAKQLQIVAEGAERAAEKREYEALAKSCSVTAEQFGQLALGMSLRDVRHIFGCVGSLSSSVDGDGLGAFSTYLWKGAHSGTAAVTTFNEDRLVTKVQNALD